MKNIIKKIVIIHRSEPVEGIYHTRVHLFDEEDIEGYISTFQKLESRKTIGMVTTHNLYKSIEYLEEQFRKRIEDEERLIEVIQKLVVECPDDLESINEDLRELWRKYCFSDEVEFQRDGFIK